MTLSAFRQGPELGPGRLDPIWSGFGLVASRKARPIRLRSARGGPRHPAAAQGGLAAPRSGQRHPAAASAAAAGSAVSPAAAAATATLPPRVP